MIDATAQPIESPSAIPPRAGPKKLPGALQHKFGVSVDALGGGSAVEASPGSRKSASKGARARAGKDSETHAEVDLVSPLINDLERAVRAL